MSILLTVNGNRDGEGFLVAPRQNNAFPVLLSLMTDDSSTVDVTLSVEPNGANVVLQTTAVTVGPTETNVSIQAMSPSTSRGDTIVHALVGGAVQASLPLTAITNLKVWFEGRFESRFATNNDPYNAPKGALGWTWTLEGEPDFVPADNVADHLDKPVGRVIRFHNPIALRSHATPIGVAVASVTGRLATGAEEEFSVGDPIVGQPVDLGPNSYFAGNAPRKPGEPAPVEQHADAAEPIGLFEFHIGSWFSGKSLTPEERPITEVTFDASGREQGTLYGLTVKERRRFHVLPLAEFVEERKRLLLDDYRALLPADRSGTATGRNLAKRIKHLGGDATLGIPPAAPTLAMGYDGREWFRGLINDAIQVDGSHSTVLAFLAGFSSFRFSTNFFNFHSDELCGQVFGYISSAEDDLVDPTDHIDMEPVPGVGTRTPPESLRMSPVRREVPQVPDA